MPSKDHPKKPTPTNQQSSVSANLNTDLTGIKNTNLGNLSPDYDKTQNQGILLNNQGSECYQKGDFDKAIQYFTESIRLAPKLAIAHYNLGTAYDEVGKYDLAVKHLTVAISLDSADPEFFYNRAITYHKLKEFDLAIKDYSSAISLGQKDSQSYYFRGMEYFNLGKISFALSDFSTSIQLNPNYLPALRKRAELYRKLGQLHLAKVDDKKINTLAINKQGTSKPTGVNLTEKSITPASKQAPVQPQKKSSPPTQTRVFQIERSGNVDPQRGLEMNIPAGPKHLKQNSQSQQKELGYFRRDQGKYGSYPLHDDYGDESGPDDNE
ncbi:MAG: tetratricopeptide repeat protein [Blastocatellia bacterium]|nr:tetratricopeptide repeat protein [Blastocatellia bacterium]